MSFWSFRYWLKYVVNCICIFQFIGIIFKFKTNKPKQTMYVPKSFNSHKMQNIILHRTQINIFCRLLFVFCVNHIRSCIACHIKKHWDIYNHLKQDEITFSLFINIHKTEVIYGVKLLLPGHKIHTQTYLSTARNDWSDHVSCVEIPL